MENKKTQPAQTNNEEERRRTRIQYFFKVTGLKKPTFSDPHALLMALGLFVGLVLAFYLKRAMPTVVFSGACFGFAFWQFWLWYSPYFQQKKIHRNRATEEEMSAWIVKDIKEVVKPKAIQTLSLNMSDVRPENFIIIPTPIYWSAPGIDGSQVKRCKLSDGTYTYSVWRVQILVLTKHYISLFKCNFNWMDLSITSISTNEFYFQDITSIRNDMREIEFKFIDDPEKPIGGGKVFCVTNFSGEYLTIINDIPSLNVTKVVSVNLEYIVSLLRMVIRNRRFGITHEEVSSQEQQAAPTSEEKHAQTVEEINSIEYLLHKREDEMDQQESQFGGTMTSSFDDDSINDAPEAPAPQS